MKKRIAELEAMRKAGNLTATELAELGELQAKLAAEGDTLQVTEGQIKEIVGTAVKTATGDLEAKVAELEKAVPSKMAHAGAEYKSPERGLRPAVEPTRKAKIGEALRSFMLDGEEKALTELTDAAGGILIPTEFRDNVIWYAGIYGIARRLCSYSPMISKEQQIDAVATEPIGYWVGEDEDSTESNVEFADIKLVAKECAVLITASKKFISDLKDARGIDIFDLLSKLIGKQMAKKEDEQMLLGDGTVFTGVLVHASVPAVVMAGTKTSFNDISYGDLIDVTRTIPVEFKKGGRPAWLMHQDVIAIIEKLTDSQNRPIFLRGTKDGEDDRLLGFPIEYSDLAPSIADDAISTKMLAFGDLDNASFGDRESLEMERHTSGTIGGVNLITKRRVGIQGTETVAFVVHNPNGFATLKTAAA